MSRRDDFLILHGFLNERFREARRKTEKIEVLGLVATMLGTLDTEVENEEGVFGLNDKAWDLWEKRAEAHNCIITHDNELIVIHG